MRFKDQVVVITGAASGFGAAAARRFAEEGARVVAADINTAGLAATVEQIRSERHCDILGIETDVTSGASVQAMIDATVETFGAVNVLVNNAGAGHAPLFLHELSEDQYDHIYNLNTKSVYFGVRSAVPVMIENGGGAIINTASIGAKSPRPKGTAYNSAKAGVWLLSKSVALHCANRGYQIRSNSIHPTFIDTPILDPMAEHIGHEELREKLARQVPLKTIGDPDDVAYAVLFLASDESKFITGSEIKIDGGISAM